MSSTAIVEQPNAVPNESLSHPEEQYEQGPEVKKNSGFLSKLNKGISRISGPLNKAVMKAGCEPFHPQNLDNDFDKAARILRSFCIDGFYSSDKDDAKSQQHGPEAKTTKVLRKIPPEVIQNCKGIAVFTTMRFGFHWSGAGGCGILMAKLPNGEWSAPSGILIHTIGWGLVAGLDVYDCVAVINSDKGMEGFTRLRGTIGAELSATAGPFGAGQTLDTEVLQRQSPVWTYMKSRGLYVGAQIDGTIVVERTEENSRFYGRQGLRARQILNGEVQAPIDMMIKLQQTLRAIEGKSFNIEDLPPPYEKTPGDLAGQAAPAEHETWPHESGS